MSYTSHKNAPITHIVGVDEAGRGPLAGPVAVGVVLVPKNFDWGLVPGVGDSKKVSPKNREAIFRHTQLLRKQGVLTYAVAMVGARAIDQIGITGAVRRAMSRAFSRIAADPSSTLVKLDGSLAAPSEFERQETIIKGDQKEKSIGLASILAKVTRDRYMARMSSKFSVYNLDIHKGYGTKQHRAAIKEHGLSSEHRSSFCRRIV